MLDQRIAVETLVARRRTHLNLRRHALAFALEQRYFGPRRLVVVFADRTGKFRGLSHAERGDPIEVTLAACMHRLSRRATAAVAYCDEAVSPAGPPHDLADRFARAVTICDGYGVRLVDWFSCDDIHVRSTRAALEAPGEWWNVR